MFWKHENINRLLHQILAQVKQNPIFLFIHKILLKRDQINIELIAIAFHPNGWGMAENISQTLRLNYCYQEIGKKYFTIKVIASLKNG